MLSGNKNTDFIILMQLTDNELGQVCMVNKYVNSICGDDDFWRNRTTTRFKLPVTVANEMKTYLQFENWKDYYIWMRELLVYVHPKPLHVIDFLFESPNLYVTKSYLDNIISNMTKIQVIEDEVGKFESYERPDWLGNDFVKQLRRRFFKDIFVHSVSEDEEMLNNEFYEIVHVMSRELTSYFPDYF